MADHEITDPYDLAEKPPLPDGEEEKLEQPEEERAAQEKVEKKRKKKEVQWKPPTYTISDAFRLFCRRTNGHGWLRIIRAPTMKGTVFWFAVTFLFFAFGVVYTATLWSRFVRYDVEVSLSTSIGKQPFPAVTICSNNPIKKSKIPEAQPSRYRERLEKIPSNINRLLNETIYYTHKLKNEALDPRYEGHKDIVAATEGTTEEQRRALGYTAKELVAYCAFAGTRCKFDSADTTTFFYDMDFGNCFTWTPTESQSMKPAGKKHALHLILNINIDDYLPFYTDSEGMKVVIHEKGAMPLPLGYGKSAPAGYETEYGLTVEQFNRLAEPYNDPGCVEDHEDFKKLFYYNYTQKGCQYTCKQLTYIKKCSCQDFREPHAFGVNFCNDNDRSVIACMADAEFSFNQQPAEHCSCPPHCLENRYTALTSLSRWPAPEFEDAFEQTYGFSPKNTASVKIYFRSAAMVLYTEIPRESPVQFLGWLGGQLSVWTGASLITVAEFIMFCVTSALVLFTENMDWLLEDSNKYLY